MKVNLLDAKVRSEFNTSTNFFFFVISGVLIFIDIPDDYKIWSAVLTCLLLIFGYLLTWQRLNRLRQITLKIDNTEVNIKVGDIFQQSGLKVIPFNEYFDTQTDDRIIAKSSLNGKFVDKFFPNGAKSLDDFIASYAFDADERGPENLERTSGKKQKYTLGTLCVYNDYILAAFSKFDSRNMANLTMPEYLEFLITFWDRINKVYAQKVVSAPVFGSGITRIKGHKDISDTELLKIMIWTYRISEMRFKHPAKLQIIIHTDRIDGINLAELSEAGVGV
jgi:hypothetical protein